MLWEPERGCWKALFVNSRAESGHKGYKSWEMWCEAPAIHCARVNLVDHQTPRVMLSRRLLLCVSDCLLPLQVIALRLRPETQ